MDDDIDAAEALTGGLCDDCTSFLSGQVRFDEQLFRQAFWTRPRCRQHLRAEFPKQADGRSASTLRSSRNEGSFASQVENSVITGSPAERSCRL